MAAWLGIGILVLFSLGLNWFMRGQRSAELVLPDDLGTWIRCTNGEPAALGTFWERRVLLHSGSLISRPYLFEQHRLRREVDGEILEVRPERKFEIDAGPSA